MCLCDDRPSCLTRTTRVARKEHACCECDVPIRKGETYELTFGVWDGKGESFKTCNNCQAITMLMYAIDREACTVFGRLFHCAGELLSERKEMREHDERMRRLRAAA